ncbi:MAG: tetratricopeptide repeat protein [Oryzomonas sp.]|uniref:tetratricopeptide repeat protein n=1 Tax=Oryzomonas sp. TaxID=2855186 RepID=UPI00284528B6|nr:tetratricopeptide repeat protein [Oryzomonas sp.]MDR3579129.1 tetratricopeptide repeat protein [Oryzomonas sp.]
MYNHNNDPNNNELNTLATLFSHGRYPEFETLALTITSRFPKHGFAWKLLGAALFLQGRTAEALAPMRKAADIFPEDTDTLSILGDIFNGLCIFSEAEGCYRRALEINPNSSNTYNNLGATLKELGRLDEAAASYKQALEIEPDFAEAHNNLGIVLKDLGRLNEAETCHRQALNINPNFCEAYNNLGIILKDMGRMCEAEACYLQALRIKPDYAEINLNLALLLTVQGKYSMAFNFAKRALQIKETVATKRIFTSCVAHIPLTLINNDDRATIVRALTEPWVRPSDLALMCTNLAMNTPGIHEIIVRANIAWPRRLSAQVLYELKSLAKLAVDPLLCGLLKSTPICNIEMERFLIVARSNMLEAATEGTASVNEIATALSFYCALASQCYINEYVFSHTDDENNKACTLRDLLISALEAKTPIPTLWPVAVAAYFPLYSLPYAARLLDIEWPEAIKTLLVQQICEPEEELQLRTGILRLTDIDDKISHLVQNQYEENPYPRWIKTKPSEKAKHFLDYLCQKFPLVSFTRNINTSSSDILIAGCGTGQHPIQTAQRFQGAHILAIDLSISSLCYAKRKTRELGLTSIEYAQADLLNLSSLGRTFDVIESCGVLHHLADPFAGWRILLSLLRPGGFMSLGFYSELARRNIAKLRDFITKQGYGSTANEIRRCRQDLIDLFDKTEIGTVIKSIDFFSISTCRDLLVHVQEHCMTLTSINTFIRENNLVFLGFDLDPEIIHLYKRRFPHDRAAINLEQWHIFENENPDLFSGMYQFWIQKA